MAQTTRFANPASTVRALQGALIRSSDPDGAKRAPGGEEYDERFIYSTERIATDGGVLLLSGWDLKDYRQNPLFIAAHDIYGWDYPLHQAVLGRAVEVVIEEGLPEDLTVSGRGLVGYVKFAPTEIGQDFRQLYGEGFLRACSVRWDHRTFQHRAPTEEEIRAYADQAAAMGQALEWVGTYQRLMECSAVMFGADPGAKNFRGMIRAAMEEARAKGVRFPTLDGVLHRIERATEPAPVPVGVDLEAIFGGGASEGDAGRGEAEAPEGEAETPTDPAGGVEGSEPTGAAEGERVQGDGAAVPAAGTEDEGEAGTREGEGEAVDQAALNDGLAALDQSLLAFDLLFDQVPVVRQGIADAVSAIRALVTSGSSAPAGAGDSDEADEEERSRARYEAAVDALEEMVRDLPAMIRSAVQEALAGAPEAPAAARQPEEAKAAGEQEAVTERQEQRKAAGEGDEEPEEVDLAAIFAGQ